jgi:preprotein translocase subunit SecG
MYGILLAILVLDGLFLGVVILLQSGKGGGLAAMGGGASATDGILAGRQATTVLTRATWIAAGIFMSLALILSILSSRSTQPQSILLDGLQQSAPAPILPGLTDSPIGDEGTTGGGEETTPPGGAPGGTPGGDPSGI